MLIAETIRISLASIRGNLFRALLTMLGIIIGVGAVITMVALGTGAQRAIDDQMAALGGDILSISSSSRLSRGVARNQLTLTTDDADALAGETFLVLDNCRQWHGRAWFDDDFHALPG